MKSNIVVIGMLSCFGRGAQAQTTPTCQPLPTVASSNAWLAETSRQPLAQQVAAVRQRATYDANVHDPSRDPKLCLVSVSEEVRRQADTRPVGVTLLYIVDGRPLQTDSVARTVRQLVTVSLVKTIQFLSGTSATAIYGTRGTNGTVFITTKQRRH